MTNRLGRLTPRLAAVSLACGVLAIVGMAGTPVFAQTDTPTQTPTNTPTNTPTQTLAPKATPGATDFGAFQYGSFRLDPPALNLGQSNEAEITIPGIKQGDLIVVYIPASLEAALVHSGTRIIANNRIGVRLSSLVNSTNGSARDWTYLWFSRTQNNCQGSPNCGPAPTVTNTPTNTPTP